MPDYNALLTNNRPVDHTQRAIDAWRRILDKPSSILIFRDQTLVHDEQTLAPQTVRVEALGNVHGAVEAAGASSVRGVVIFGVYNHPSQPNTDIRRGDRFTIHEYPYGTSIPKWNTASSYGEAIWGEAEWSNGAQWGDAWGPGEADYTEYYTVVDVVRFPGEIQARAEMLA